MVFTGRLLVTSSVNSTCEFVNKSWNPPLYSRPFLITMGKHGKSKLGKRKRQGIEIVKKDEEAEPLPQTRPSDEPAPKKVLLQVSRMIISALANTIHFSRTDG